MLGEWTEQTRFLGHGKDYPSKYRRFYLPAPCSVVSHFSVNPINPGDNEEMFTWKTGVGPASRRPHQGSSILTGLVGGISWSPMTPHLGSL